MAAYAPSSVIRHSASSSSILTARGGGGGGGEREPRVGLEGEARGWREWSVGLQMRVNRERKAGDVMSWV